MSKMGLHDPFGYLKHKLWPNEWMRVYNLHGITLNYNMEMPQKFNPRGISFE
jgi:hypothetical protein